MAVLGLSVLSHTTLEVTTLKILNAEPTGTFESFQCLWGSWEGIGISDGFGIDLSENDTNSEITVLLAHKHDW